MDSQKEKFYLEKIAKLERRIIQLENNLALIYQIDNLTDTEILLENLFANIKDMIVEQIPSEYAYVYFIDKKNIDYFFVLSKPSQQTNFKKDFKELALHLLNYVEPEILSKNSLLEKVPNVPEVIKNILIYPVRLPVKVNGIFLIVNKKNKQTFTKNDITKMKSILTDAGKAIEHALLFKKLKNTIRDLEDKNRELQALYNVSHTLNFLNTLDSVLQAILDNAINYLEAEWGSIMLLNEQTMELSVSLVRGLKEKNIKPSIKLKLGEGIAGMTAKSGKPMLVKDGYNSPYFKKFKKKGSHHRKVRSLICAPIRYGKETFGVINIVNPRKRKVFTDEDLKLLESLACSAGVTLKNFKLNEVSLRDSLLGIYHHEYFVKTLKTEFERAKRYQTALAIMMIDVDNFKSINDNYGHQTGDRALLNISSTLLENCRTIDSVCRYGGEEFGIILPETELDGALILAERLRKKIEEIEFFYKDKKLLITVSIGVSCYTPKTKSHEELVELADQALYYAKRHGKNMVWHKIKQ